MSLVENAVLELDKWSEDFSPDNLPAFILARHILGVIPIDSTVDISPYCKEYMRLANEKGLLEFDGEVIDEWEFELLVRDAMHKVKYPKGREMDHLVNRALKQPIPIDLQSIKDPDGQLIARVCRLLQHDAGKQPFHLSQTNAGKIVNKKRATGSRKLLALQSKGFIQLVRKGFPGVSSYYHCYERDSFLSIHLKV